MKKSVMLLSALMLCGLGLSACSDTQTADTPPAEPLTKDYAEIPYTGTVPAELEAAITAYNEDIARQLEMIESGNLTPEMEARAMLSSKVFPYGAIEIDPLLERAQYDCAVRCFADVYEMAITDGEYRDEAQQLVKGILCAHIPSSVKGGYFRDQLRQLYAEAEEAARELLADGYTAWECDQLKREYGFLSAAVLAEQDKLMLLGLDSSQAHKEEVAGLLQYIV